MFSRFLIILVFVLCPVSISFAAQTKSKKGTPCRAQINFYSPFSVAEVLKNLPDKGDSSNAMGLRMAKVGQVVELDYFTTRSKNSRKVSVIDPVTGNTRKVRVENIIGKVYEIGSDFIALERKIVDGTGFEVDALDRFNFNQILADTVTVFPLGPIAKYFTKAEKGDVINIRYSVVRKGRPEPEVGTVRVQGVSGTEIIISSMDGEYTLGMPIEYIHSLELVH